MTTSEAMGVPDWCAFFDAEDYERFCASVDRACMGFGADGQDLDEGCVRLASGAAYALNEFPLARLARRCRDSPVDDWDDICSFQIDDWTMCTSQQEWLERAPLDAVRHRLRPRLGPGGRMFVG